MGAQQVELVSRLMAALASRGQAASKVEEAVALLSESLGSSQLLADGCLAEYNGCLSCVLDCCTRLAPSTVSRLLACFDLGGFSAAIFHCGTPDAGYNAVRHFASFASVLCLSTIEAVLLCQPFYWIDPFCTEAPSL